MNFFNKKAKAQKAKAYKFVPVKETDPAFGLTDAEVTERNDNGQSNLPVESPMKSERQIIFDNCFTFFNMVFFILAVCLLLVGRYKEIAFLGIVIANTAIGIYQEIRSKRTVDKLTLMNVRTITAIRNGVETSIATDKLVRDDIVEFHAGDQICADAIVVTGSIRANESLITGEADEIQKDSGDMLLSGSFIVSGTCRARLTSVGADSYASKLTLEAKNNTKSSQSEMMRSLDRLIRIIGIILGPLGIALFIKQYFLFIEDPNITSTFGAIREAVSATVSALIGMIPEGLYLLTSVALAVSVFRLAKKKVLTQDLNCIETLARVDALCVDKTGTITESKMEALEPIPLDPQAYDADTVDELLSGFYNAADADNDTSRALADKFKGPTSMRPMSKIPFSSATKWSSVTFKDGHTYIVGAPEFVMTHRYGEVEDDCYELSSKGYRVLVFCEYCGTLKQGDSIDSEMCVPIALLPLINRVRPEAPATFSYFASQGVDIYVISGDNPRSVSEIAKQAGIKNADLWVDAKTLKSDSDYDAAVKRYNVFGRVTPDQKRKLVAALKKQGKTVAMTGDGVNDVLALKDSDCGIAMASGSEAACHVAKLVLLNSDFSALPSVVAEGRRVINNIERSASLFLVKNIFSFALSIITLFFANMPYPMMPLHLSMISALTIGIPSFVLALEPNKELVKGKFLRNVLTKATPGAVTNILMILLLEMFYLTFGRDVISLDSLRTMSALIVSVIGLMVLYHTCKPLNWKRWTLVGVMSAGVLFCFTVLSGLFEFATLDAKTGLIIFVLLLLSIYNIKFINLGFSYLFDLAKKLIKLLKEKAESEE